MFGLSRLFRAAKAELVPPGYANVFKFDPAQPRDKDGKWTAEGANAESPAFKKWFGDSKVVDEDGKPKVFYHATLNGDIHEFNAKQGQREDDELHESALNWFGTTDFVDKYTSSVLLSSDYNEEQGPDLLNKVLSYKEGNPTIYPVFLKVENPLDLTAYGNILDGKGLYRVARELGEKLGIDEGSMESIKADIRSGEENLYPEDYEITSIVSLLQNEYVQSYFAKSKFDGIKAIETDQEVWGVKGSNQIKSATGNKGTYDANEKDITKGEGFARIFKFDPAQPRDKDGKVIVVERVGRAKAEDIQKSEKGYANVFKANPNHDEKGRFASAPGGGVADLPPEPGTAPVKEGYVRLYHQTAAENLDSIRKNGITIDHAKGIEGPKAVYAGETPFYGPADKRPTIEFQVPKKDWDAPFVLRDVTPKDFIAVHEPWHSQARYLEKNPDSLKEALAGKFDDLTGDYKQAVEYVKAKYGSKVQKFNHNHDDKGRFASAHSFDLKDVSELHDVLKELRSDPDRHPNIMEMKVAGKPLFHPDKSLGIARIDMPQIPSKERASFIKSLGEKVKEKSFKPAELFPTQDQLDGFKTAALAHKMANDDNFHPEPILLANDHYIIDGHHHWAAAMVRSMKNPDTKIKAYVVDMPHEELLKAAHDYASEHGFEAKSISKAQKGFAGVFKFNPNHDSTGKFSSGPGGGAPDHTLEAYAREHQLGEKTTPESLMSTLSKADQAEIKLAVAKAQTLPSTEAMYSKGGIYSADRQALHQQIIDRYTDPEVMKRAMPAPGEKPTLIVLGGRGGSGKSAFTNGTLKEFDGSNYEVLDSDAIKSQLPEFKGWNAAQVHEESSHIEGVIRSTLLAHGVNLVLDKTLSSVNSLEGDIKQAIASGYRVEGHYMYLPPAQAASRALSRYLGKGPGMRGRLVPPQMVLNMKDNEANFDSLKKYFSRWSEYDNSGTGPKLIARGGKG